MPSDPQRSETPEAPMLRMLAITGKMQLTQKDLIHHEDATTRVWHILPVVSSSIKWSSLDVSHALQTMHGMNMFMMFHITALIKKNSARPTQQQSSLHLVINPQLQMVQLSHTATWLQRVTTGKLHELFVHMNQGLGEPDKVYPTGARQAVLHAAPHTADQELRLSCC